MWVIFHKVYFCEILIATKGKKISSWEIINAVYVPTQIKINIPDFFKSNIVFICDPINLCNQIITPLWCNIMFFHKGLEYYFNVLIFTETSFLGFRCI